MSVSQALVGSNEKELSKAFEFNGPRFLNHSHHVTKRVIFFRHGWTVGRSRLMVSDCEDDFVDQI